MTKVYTKLEILSVRSNLADELKKLAPTFTLTGFSTEVSTLAVAVHRNDADDYSLALRFENEGAQKAFEANFAALAPDSDLVQALRDVPVVKKIAAVAGTLQPAKA